MKRRTARFMMCLFAVAALLMFASGAAFAAYSATVYVRTDCSELENCDSCTCETNPATAVSNITGASSSNIYLVDVGPGTFDIGLNTTLTMKSYVDIIGAGQDETTIKGHGDNSGSIYYSVVQGADNAKLESLTVEAYGARSQNIAIHNESGAPAISNVKAYAHDSYDAHNIGIKNEQSVVLDNVSVTASGTINGRAYGIWNESGISLTMYNCDVTIPSSTSATINYGISNYGNGNTSSILMTNSDITVDGHYYSCGIDARSGPVTIVRSTMFINDGTNGVGILTAGDIIVNESTISAEDSDLDGIAFYGNDNLSLYRSIVKGGDRSVVTYATPDVYITNTYLSGDIYVPYGTIDITVSTVDGSPSGSATYSCVGVYDSSLNTVTCP